jgi:hypothetical protein
MSPGANENTKTSDARRATQIAAFKSPLDPPPGPPMNPDGTFAALPEWPEGAPRPPNWPPHIHPPRHVSAAKAQGRAAAPAVITAPREPEPDLVIRAFLDTRDGYSPDYAVACPEANARFLQRARQLGVGGREADINRLLLNARKASKLKGQPSEKEYRLSSEYEPWIFASEWAMRHLQRLLVKESDRLVALDDILCDPARAARFDEVVARIKPGFAKLDYRWAALGMRKKGKSTPAARDLKVRLERQMTFDDALGGAPHGPGLYLIRCATGAVYVNHATDLRDQIDRHTKLSGEELIPNWLTEGFGRPSGMSYAYLAGITTDKLREVRISGVAEYRPWLNLLDLEGAA